MRSKVNLGKRWYSFLRYEEGHWSKGEYVAGAIQEIRAKANIQPAFQMSQTKLLPESEREKESVWGSSNQWLYAAQSGKETYRGDVFFYNNALWEVKGIMPYENFGTHCEFVAVKLTNEVRGRVKGNVYRYVHADIETLTEETVVILEEEDGKITWSLKNE